MSLHEVRQVLRGTVWDKICERTLQMVLQYFSATSKLKYVLVRPSTYGLEILVVRAGEILLLKEAKMLRNKDKQSKHTYIWIEKINRKRRVIALTTIHMDTQSTILAPHGSLITQIG